MEPTPQNTLDLARQGDPAAIAVILTYHLSQQSNTSASAIRLGSYLSVLIDTSYTAPPDRLVHLVLSILQDLDIQGISTVEINARQTDHPEVHWSQTIELTDLLIPTDTMTELPPADDSATSPQPDSGEVAERSPEPPAPIALTPETGEPSLYAFLQRPELVALLAFAVILVLWDAYIEWMGEIDATQPLTGVKLAKRLGVSPSTLSRVRYNANFSDWSRTLDPDGIAWSYEKKLYVPQVYRYATRDRALLSLTH
jgi:hypothetical protein